jgi:hypothetical protein
MIRVCNKSLLGPQPNRLNLHATSWHPAVPATQLEERKENEISQSFRIGTDAHLYDDPEDVNIAPLLDSKFDSEKCEALKRLLALIAQGFDVSNFFPQVALLIYAFSSVWLLRNKKKRSYDSENYNYSLVLS